MTVNTARASALMQEESVDAVIAATLENNFYFGGFWIDGQEMFPLDSESYTVVPASAPDAGIVVCSIGSADMALGGYPTLGGIVTFGTFFRDEVPGVELEADEEFVREVTARHVSGRDPVSALVEAIEEIGAARGRIAVDERGPRRELIAQLREALPQAQFVPASGLLRAIRAVKTPDEIEQILAALRVTEDGLRAAFDAFSVGVTERAVYQAFTASVVAAGAKPGFCLVRFGKGLALGQVPPAHRRLTPGDFAFFDVGVNLGGYKSDIGRLVSFGEPNPQIAALFRASKAGQQAAIDAMRPGAVAKDIFALAVRTVADSGIPTYRRQHVGHGIGVEYYDLPVLTPDSSTVLEENMVFEVETPYYRLGVGGAFIEDTVVIRETCAEIVTSLPREFIELPVR
ncbi:MAG: Xaa-Pro peptidase family protein [Bifidobacteriaceae bacterium]|jgi:Xaa-Pro aminopeptidase|nr:Xaa-Pro peptidase family protein [Bifidobacteriaceae bacterium]